MRTLARFVALAGVLSAAACSEPNGLGDVRLHVTSDASTYTRGASGEALVTITVRHEGGRAIALTGCPHPPSAYIDRATSSGWEEQTANGLTCLAIYSPSTVALNTGSTISFSVPLRAAARYRVRVLVGPDPGAPELTVASNEFEVK